MATIIDSLVVKLGWDEKDLEAKVPGIKKALGDVEKEGDKTEKSLKKTAKTTKDSSHEFDNLKKSVGGFLALIGGSVAIKAFVSDMIDSSAALNRLSQNLGLSVSNISAWSNATERLGGSAQGLQGTLDMLSKAQTQLMLTGESSLIPYFSALGVSLADVHGKARPVTELFLDLNKSLNDKMAGGMSRTAANNLLRMMGIDQGTANLILLNRKELELELKRQKEYGDQVAKFAPIAQKFQTAMVGIKQKFTLLGLTLLEEAAPAIEKVLTYLEKFADWLIANKETVKDFALVLGTVAAGFALISIASSPIALTTAAIIALAAGIALLWQDYQTWKRGGDSLIDWSKWEPGIDAATAGIRGLRDVIVGVIEGARDLKNMVSDHPWIGKALGVIVPGFAAFRFAESTINDGAPNPNRRSGLSSTRLIPPGILSFGAQSFGASSPGSANADYIKKYFQGQGWSAAQAAGIAANLMSESSGNIKATGDNGTAFGLVQWHSDRQAAFAQWAGHDIRSATLAEQLAFVQYELTHGGEKAAGDALRKQTTAFGAGSVLSQSYERPKDAAGEASRRGTYAQSILNGVPGASAFAGNAPQGSGGPATTSVDKSIETHIGEINIQTKATDAQGIASDMEHALDYLFVGQANYGLT